MTQQEFFERTQLLLSEQDFYQVTDMYLAVGDHVDKDAFCMDYKKHRQSLLLHNYFAKCQSLENKLNELNERMTSTAELLLANCKNSPKNYELAVSLTSQQFVTLYKIENNLPLCDADVKFIKTNLK